MTFIKKEYKAILFFMLLMVINICIFNHKFLDIIYSDIGREAYFAQEILNGQLMYRDFFNNYTPFNHLFLALAFKIFGIHLDTLFYLGCINALSIILLLYSIAKRFLSRMTSVLFCVFIMEFCVFQATAVNFIMPYTYAMVFGINFALISIVSYFNYWENPDKKIFLPIAFLSVGLAISNKYEFLFLLLLLLVDMLRRKTSIKDIGSMIAITFLPLILLLILLFYQGLTYSDMANYLNFSIKYVNTDAMKEFYSGLTLFDFKIFVMTLKSFLIASLLGFGSYWYGKFISNKSKFVKIIMTFGLAYIFLLVIFNHSLYFRLYFFNFLPVMLFVLALIKAKYIYKSTSLFIFVGFSILFSLKTFWSLSTTFGYGQYTLPFILLSIIILLKEFYIKDVYRNKIYKNTTIWFFSIYLFACFIINLHIINARTYKVETPRGIFYSMPTEGKMFEDLFSYIKTQTKNSDKILVFPESDLINFLTDRQSDGNYCGMKPELVEAYGEKNLIQHFQNEPPEYIVVINYFFRSEIIFGYDYAKDFYSWIKDNYTLEKVYQGKSIILIYKRWN
ncbi:MAG: glycosyltransferase family 39 protein [Candidatus Gastranaerophilales bacterium]|nr:glycosyltransferase family 39 protein [Candidatus Gastranaerophilales bacterium]